MRASIIIKPWIGAVVREIYAIVDAEGGALPRQPDEADNAYGEAIGECLKRIEETAKAIGVSLDRPDDADKERLAAMVADAAGDAQLDMHDPAPASPAEPIAVPRETSSPIAYFISQARQLRRVTQAVIKAFDSRVPGSLDSAVDDLDLILPHFDSASADLLDCPPQPTAERWVEATDMDGETIWVNMARVRRILRWNARDGHGRPTCTVLFAGTFGDADPTCVTERPEHFLPKPRWP